MRRQRPELPLVTHSERQTAACPARWLMRYGLGLRRPELSPALYVGSLVHAGIEALTAGLAHDQRRPQHWSLSSASTAIRREAARWMQETVSMRGGIALSDEELTQVDAMTWQADRLLRSYHDRYCAEADWLEIENELSFDVRLRQPVTYGRIPARLGGRIDRVVQRGGQLWIVETKTTSLPLAEWIERHRRSPQAATYAVALAAAGRPHIVGVIYDLIQSRPPKAAIDLEVVKAGSRLAKPSGLPWTTAGSFLGAVTALSQDLDSVDWYRDVHERLMERDQSGFWMRRETLRFEERELYRARVELETDLRRHARWRRLVETYQAPVVSAQLSERDAGTIAAILRGSVEDFPRQPSLCWQYNRLCSYAALCASHSAEDLSPYVMTGSSHGHDELSASSIEDEP